MSDKDDSKWLKVLLELTRRQGGKMRNNVFKFSTCTNEAGCSRERKAKRARTFDPASSSAAEQHEAASSQMALSNAKRAKHAKQGTALLPASAHALVTACPIQQPCSLVFVSFRKDYIKQVDFAKGPFTLSVIRINFF